jgi:hypothetical protein
MNKEPLVKDQVDFQTIGEEISHELAAKMVKDHHDKYTLDESNSYFIGKNIIDQVMAQPGCIGIRFFDALNEAGDKTLVYVGIDVKGKSIVEITTINDNGKLAIIKATIGDQLFTPKPINWFD